MSLGPLRECLCVHCGDLIGWFDTRHRQRACHACKRARVLRQRAVRAGDWIPSAVRKAVIARDGYCCRYCDAPLVPRRHKYDMPADALELDHIVCVADGGKSTAENLVVSCLRCNRRKSDRPPLTMPAA